MFEGLKRQRDESFKKLKGQTRAKRVEQFDHFNC